MHCQATIALQYSNDLWKSRTAPVFETLSLKRVFGALSVTEIRSIIIALTNKEGVWCTFCYRD